MPEIIDHSVEFLAFSGQSSPIKAVESAARTCYQSESVPNATIEESKAFVRRLISRGHTAMIEFAAVGFRITTDRGVSHELVRHRIASWAQESTRYCNYGGKPIQFVKPVNLQERMGDTMKTPEYKAWYASLVQAEESYNTMLRCGCSPQIARSVLPNSLKTEICMKMNMRSFRNFVMLRTAKEAHPDMRYVAGKCVELVRNSGYWIFIEDIAGDAESTR